MTEPPDESGAKPTPDESGAGPTDRPAPQAGGNDGPDDSDDWDDWDDEWNAPSRRRFSLDSRSAWTLVVAGAAVVVLVAILVALLVVGGHHGGSTPSPTQSGTAAAGHGVTCSVVAQDPTMTNRFTFSEGGTVPSGVPLPGPPPAHVCSGAPVHGPKTDVTALIWPNVSIGSYQQQLSDAQWTFQLAGPAAIYTNVGSPYQIALVTVNGALVALYHE